MDKSDTYILASGAGSEVYLVKGKTLNRITIDQKTQNKILKSAELSLENMLSDLFQFPDLVLISDREYLERTELLTLMKNESGAINDLEFLQKNRKIVKKSELLKRLNQLTDNFDSKLFKKLKNVESIEEYSLSPVVDGEHGYIEMRTFINDWLLML